MDLPTFNICVSQPELAQILSFMKINDIVRLGFQGNIIGIDVNVDVDVDVVVVVDVDFDFDFDF